MCYICFKENQNIWYVQISLCNLITSQAVALGGEAMLNVEKDGPRNSSKFDEKKGVVEFRCEQITNSKYFM